MKINFRKLVWYFLIGIGFGSLSFVATLWLEGTQSQTVPQITNVIWVSGLIGIISMIFELERPPFFFRLILHFFLVYALVCLMNNLNHYYWPILSFELLGNFMVSYLIIWTIVYFFLTRRLGRINQRLAEKREKPRQTHEENNVFR